MEFPTNAQQEYEQLMYVMDKKDWLVLQDNLHNPDVLPILVRYTDAMTQRKQAQSRLYEYQLTKESMSKDSFDMRRLMDCAKENKQKENEQLKLLTHLLYGKEMTYEELLALGHLTYVFV